jgi:hypothetical protein
MPPIRVGLLCRTLTLRRRRVIGEFLVPQDDRFAGRHVGRERNAMMLRHGRSATSFFELTLLELGARGDAKITIGARSKSQGAAVVLVPLAS